MDDGKIAGAVERQLSMAERFFVELAHRTRDGDGVTRAAWSDEDQVAIDMLASAGRDLGLEVEYDPAGNVYLTLPGRNRNLPAVLMGSHCDSVPTGGNYDGAAGAVAGLVVLAALKEEGVTPPCDMRCVGLRGEESVWYGIAYIGSRLAVGSLDPAEADRLVRGDTGRTLADHMRALGIDPAALRAAGPYISPANTRAFLELHIEQGPVLVARNLPAAIPTVIRASGFSPWNSSAAAVTYGPTVLEPSAVTVAPPPPPPQPARTATPTSTGSAATARALRTPLESTRRVSRTPGEDEVNGWLQNGDGPVSPPGCSPARR